MGDERLAGHDEVQTFPTVPKDKKWRVADPDASLLATNRVDGGEPKEASRDGPYSRRGPAMAASSGTRFCAFLDGWCLNRPKKPPSMAGVVFWMKSSDIGGE